MLWGGRKMTIFLKRVELLGGDGYEFQCPRQRDGRAAQTPAP